MEQQERYWQAVQERDADFDGRFYYGVVTTGVFCKPSCKSRLALRSNVRFFDSVAAAEAAGLRACKKCRPDNANTAMEEVVHALCRHIEHHPDTALSLADIAKKSGYSAAHLQKSFIRIVGSSPKAYQEGLRKGRLKSDLRSARNVADAIYNAGFSSPSRVYEKLARHIGMTPKQYRQGGEQVTMYYASSVTSLGLVLIAATERGICFLQFGDDSASLFSQLQIEFPHATLHPMPENDATQQAQWQAWIQALNAYLDDKKHLQELPLDLRGTAFQMLVWRYLQTIPAGTVSSYTEVAQAIGKPKAARAVASACANNRIAIIIPCHRVLRGDGQLAGYRWGLERKRTLLALEQTSVQANDSE